VVWRYLRGCGRMEEGGFTLVTKSSKMRARPRKGEVACMPSSSSSADDDVTMETCLARIKEARSHLASTQWLTSVKGMVTDSAPQRGTSGYAAGGGAAVACSGVLNHAEAGVEDGCTFHDIVCYGVGHFGHGGASALQAALALELRESLAIAGDLFLFDPVLSPNERAAAVSCGFTMIDQNETGLRNAKVSTLFFMPHCGRRLYSNVLRANWTPEALSSLAILGNSFSAYRVRMLSPRKQECCCVSRLGDQVIEQALPLYPFAQAAFNDTCLHTFPPSPGLERLLGEGLSEDRGGDDHGWC